ncbi:guanylate kinase-associated protein mars-like isoform X2 [Drosophila serrata]|uniref:guanylate kinase-associated protein mars-like isoform X2 n=1 Tax=Drosophila serrata TaxID=7274 RepID=UPI000A1D0C72|nr:guanylate kinase-associated protein mars-like isoform X2 [Drosophila serrata]
MYSVDFVTLSQSAFPYKHYNFLSIFTILFTMELNVQDHFTCTNNFPDESSSSDDELESNNIHLTPSLEEMYVQQEVETPEMMELIVKFEKLTIKEPEQPLDPIQAIPEEEICNGDPEPVVLQESIDTKSEINVATEDLYENPADPDVLMENSKENSDQSEVTAAEVVKDGNYFLKILKDEQKRLLDLANTADHYAAVLVTRKNRWEYAFEKLRLFSGLAKLLVSSKMNQFEEICLKNINSSPNEDFPVTNDDLHGFWDMIYLQIPALDAHYAEIEKIRDNNWKPPATDAAQVPSTSGRQRNTNLKTREKLWRNN